MIATKTQPVQLDLGVTVLEESLWYLPNNSEGDCAGNGHNAKVWLCNLSALNSKLS